MSECTCGTFAALACAFCVARGSSPSPPDDLDLVALERELVACSRVASAELCASFAYNARREAAIASVFAELRESRAKLAVSDAAVCAVLAALYDATNDVETRALADIGKRVAALAAERDDERERHVRTAADLRQALADTASLRAVVEAAKNAVASGFDFDETNALAERLRAMDGGK